MGEALLVLPGFFEFGTRIEGIDATDLFSLTLCSVPASRFRSSTRLIGCAASGIRTRSGSAIDSRGNLRPFRMSGSFGEGQAHDIAMGIELKGWYLLSKEGVPSLRFPTTPAACSPFDLIAVVPWHLSNVLSGTPVAREPWVSSARHAAEFRNHWWKNVRETSDPKVSHRRPECTRTPLRTCRSGHT